MRHPVNRYILGLHAGLEVLRILVGAHFYVRAGFDAKAGGHIEVFEIYMSQGFDNLFLDSALQQSPTLFVGLELDIDFQILVHIFEIVLAHAKFTRNFP